MGITRERSKRGAGPSDGRTHWIDQQQSSPQQSSPSQHEMTSAIAPPFIEERRSGRVDARLTIVNENFAVLQSLCCGPDVEALEPDAADDLAAVFKALGDPTRVAIVSRLASGEKCCVCDLTDVFELSQPTISHHLRILREAGLVDSERRGTFAYYWLVPEAIERLQAVFQPPSLVPA